VNEHYDSCAIEQNDDLSGKRLSAGDAEFFEFVSQPDQ
jgi:hypothetical protein